MEDPAQRRLGAELRERLVRCQGAVLKVRGVYVDIRLAELD